MARGVRRDLDERIIELKDKLEKKQAEVAEIKGQIKELESAKQAELLTKVAEVAAAKGISVEELLESVVK